jgi:hypothetical protein
VLRVIDVSIGSVGAMYSRWNASWIWRIRAPSRCIGNTLITWLNSIAAGAQRRAVVALEQRRDAALARLAVDPDDGFVGPATSAGSIGRYGTSTTRGPAPGVLLRGETFLDCVRCDPEKDVNASSPAWMARMHWQSVQYSAVR